MNKIPSILVDTGFEVDANGALTEIDIPSVVDTLNAPRKITFNGTTLNYMPSTAAALQEIDAPNCLSIPVSAFKGFTLLTTAKLDKLPTINTPSGGGAFNGCTNLTSVSLPALTSISCNSAQQGNAGAFYGCTSLTSISLPALTSITVTSTSGAGTIYIGAFCNCTSLKSINLPALTSISTTSSGSSYGGAFYGCAGLVDIVLPSLVTCSTSSARAIVFGGCTSLKTVQLGSEGHAVTSLGQYMFYGLTQSDLTITVYTNGGASLAGEPWGATNADIEYEEA